LMEKAQNVASVAMRLGANVASLVPNFDLRRRAVELDFAVASRIDRIRSQLLAPRRVNRLASQLQAEFTALEALQTEVPARAAEDLAAQKVQTAWLLSELRKAM